MPLPSPQDLARQDLRAVLRDASRKQGFVTPMFEHIAPRYDAFTRLFSFGMDAGWKRRLLGWLAAQQPAPHHILDVACGTGDFSFGALERHPHAEVTGVDAAERMIALANARLHRDAVHGISFTVGDLTATGLPGASVDAVVAGYAFRNIPRLDDGLAEAARVLRPGGWLYTLDFYRPRTSAWRACYLAYLRVAGSALGWWWHRSPVMYAYIADSIEAWLPVEAFDDALTRHGFAVERKWQTLGGGLAVHAGRRR